MKYDKIIKQIYDNLPESEMRCKHYSVLLAGNKIICSGINQQGCHAEISALKRGPLRSPKDRKRLQA